MKAVDRTVFHLTLLKCLLFCTKHSYENACKIIEKTHFSYNKQYLIVQKQKKIVLISSHCNYSVLKESLCSYGVLEAILIVR